MIVNDILAQAKAVFGRCDTTELYRNITDAIELLANESNWDSMTGEVTVIVDETGCVALPPDVETPLAVQIDGYPAFNRDKWFKYHINGPGAYTSINSFREFWDDMGEFPLISDLSGNTTIQVDNDDVADAALTVKVFGLDGNNEEVIENGTRGVTLSMGVPSTVTFSVITEIQKPESTGIIRLKEINTGTVRGIYYPDETNPRIRRMRVPKSSTISMRYRRRTREVKTPEDPIPLNSRMALKAAMESIKYMNNGNIEQMGVWRQLAVELARKEQDSRNAQSGIGPQVQNFTTDINASLRNGYTRNPRYR